MYKPLVAIRRQLIRQRNRIHSTLGYKTPVDFAAVHVSEVA